MLNFKIRILTYEALNELAPPYLSEMFVPVAVNLYIETGLPIVVT